MSITVRGNSKEYLSIKQPVFGMMDVKICLELDDILLQEAKFWQQKSRNKWLKEGEQNTRNFHRSTLTQKKRNKITCFKDAFD